MEGVDMIQSDLYTFLELIAFKFDYFLGQLNKT